MSRALLLSRDAEADAKPELEIFADDVVCSHGATVGELDETLLFYLKSRGIDEAKARTMLIDAFLVDTLEEISYQPFADFLRGQVSGWTARQTGVE
jgi:Fe-S cluster assembly protein SufD